MSEIISRQVGPNNAKKALRRAFKAKRPVCLPRSAQNLASTAAKIKIHAFIVHE